MKIKKVQEKLCESYLSRGIRLSLLWHRAQRSRKVKRRLHIYTWEESVYGRIQIPLIREVSTNTVFQIWKYKWMKSIFLLVYFFCISLREKCLPISWKTGRGHLFIVFFCIFTDPYSIHEEIGLNCFNLSLCMMSQKKLSPLFCNRFNLGGSFVYFTYTSWQKASKTLVLMKSSFFCLHWWNLPVSHEQLFRANTCYILLDLRYHNWQKK